jgi:predicted dehydrogenase
MNYVAGPPEDVLGAVLERIYSRDVEDAVYATLAYPSGISGQLATNWSDETYRRMTTRLTVQGTRGKIIADREECRLYLSAAPPSAEFASGWTVRNITELQPPVAYYLRGEEYTAQLDHFVRAVETGAREPHASSFATALEVDLVIDRLLHSARGAAA